MSKNKESIFPAYLYYGSTMADNSQTSEATGAVNPIALHENKDSCWIADSKKSEASQKAIIINTLSFESHLKVILELFDAGFKIYFHNPKDGTLNKFQHSTFFYDNGERRRYCIQKLKLQNENDLRVAASKTYKITASVPSLNP